MLSEAIRSNKSQSPLDGRGGPRDPGDLQSREEECEFSCCCLMTVTSMNCILSGTGTKLGSQTARGVFKRNVLVRKG